MITRISSPYLGKLILLYQYQGITNNCAPFCAAMTINALKDTQLDGHTLSVQMDAISPFFFWRWRRIPGWATFPWGLVGLFKDYGLRASWSFFQSKNQILRMLNEQTVILLIIGGGVPFWAHVVILLDYDIERGWGILDPAHRQPELRWVSHERLVKQWRAWGNQMITVYNNSVP